MFRSQDLVLVHDSDSAHLAYETDRWVKVNGLKVLQLPRVSPDFSVFESLAAPLKRKPVPAGVQHMREHCSDFRGFSCATLLGNL